MFMLICIVKSCINLFMYVDTQSDCIYVAYGKDVLCWCISTQKLKVFYMQCMCVGVFL